MADHIDGIDVCGENADAFDAFANCLDDLLDASFELFLFVD